MSDQKLVSEEPEMGAFDLTEELIRARAYEFYEQRGCENGHDLDDWLNAETELIGKKTSQSATAPRKKASSATAA